jgi:hypothetical protein
MISTFKATIAYWLFEQKTELTMPLDFSEITICQNVCDLERAFCLDSRKLRTVEGEAKQFPRYVPLYDL